MYKYLSGIEIVGHDERPPEVVSYGDVMLKVGHLTAEGEVVCHLDRTTRISESGQLRLKLKNLRTWKNDFRRLLNALTYSTI